MKIRPVGAELFHVGGQRDMSQLIVALRNLRKRLKMLTSPWRAFVSLFYVQNCLSEFSEMLYG